MKIALTILICSLLAGSAVAQASCATASNPFLAWLAGIDSTFVLAAPNTSSPFSVCNELWTTTNKVGTCCDVAKLQTAFDNRMKAAAAHWTDFFKSIFIFRSIVGKLAKIQGSDLTTQTAAMRTDTANFELGGLTDAQITDILSIVQNIESRLATFKSDAKICWAAAVQMRAKVFCHGCWAFGGSLFTANTDTTTAPSITLKATTANSVVASCATTWKFIYDLSVSMNLLAQIVKKRTGKGNPPTNDFKFSNKVANTVSTIKTAIDACASASPPFALGGTCTQAYLDTIGASFFSWAGNERLVRPLQPEGNVNNFNRRLLQAAPSDDSSYTPNSSGVDLSMTITTPTTSAVFDTSSAGNAPSSSSLLIKGALSLLAICIAILA